MMVPKVMKKQKGQAMVEFVIIAPVLLMIVFGIIQFGILFNNYLTLTDAVRNGARQAAVSRTAAHPVKSATDRVKAAASDLNIANLTIEVIPRDPVTGAQDWVQGGDVTVSATYPYSIDLLGFVVKSGLIKSQTTERVE